MTITIAALDELAGGFDIGPGHEWYSELAAAFGPDPVPPVLTVAPVAVKRAKPHCKKCCYLTAWCPCPGGPRA